MPNVKLRTLNNIGDPITSTNGTVLAGTRIAFDLYSTTGKVTTLFDAYTDELIVAKQVSAVTDVNGEFTIDLWPNTRGNETTLYVVTVGSNKPFQIKVEDGESVLSLANARRALSVLTPTETSVFTALLDRLDASVLLYENTIVTTNQKAIDAEASANLASGFATSAGNSANSAANSLNNAATQATNAANSAIAAAGSATTAAGSATTAAGSATAAAGSAATASGYLTDAQLARNAAQTSATNAGTSETNAAASAGAASTSATNAAASATTASNQLTAVNSAITTQNAKIVTDNATIDGKVTAANTSATNSANSATASAGSATAAAASATNSANSATAAAGSATAASGSATAASGSAATAVAAAAGVTAIISATFAASAAGVKGYRYAVDTRNSALIMTLPSSASVGDMIELIDAYSNFNVNTLTLVGNGLHVDGSRLDTVLSTKGLFVRMTYSGALYGWKLSEILPATTLSDGDYTKVFEALLSVNEQPSRGVGNAAFTRLSGAYVPDFEGKITKIAGSATAAGSPAFPGNRAVTNIVLNSNNLQTGWTTVGATVNDSTHFTMTADTILDAVYSPVSGPAGTYVMTAVVSGSGNIRFGLNINGTNVHSANITLTAEDRRIAYTFDASAGVVAYVLILNGTAAGVKTVKATNIQVENVTGQSNKNPSEYVPTTTIPVTKWFDTYNPCVVGADNVVWQNKRVVSNLVLNSDNIGGSNWTVRNFAIGTPYYAQAPDGSMTAYRIQGAATNWNYVDPGTTQCNIGDILVTSAWIKSNTTAANILFRSVNNTIIPITTSWQRYSLTEIAVGTTVAFVIGTGPMTPATDIDICIWRPQLENVTNQLNRNPGEYVGTLATIKSQGFSYLNPNTVATYSVNDSGVRTPWTGVVEPVLGSELVVNGDFTSATGWLTGTGITFADGVCKYANVALDAGTARLGILNALPTLYRIEYTISNYVSGGFSFYAGAYSDKIRTANGTYVEYFTSAPLGVNASFIARTAPFTGWLDNVSVKEVIASTAGSNVIAPLLGSELHTGWTNQVGYLYSTFDTSGKDITLAIALNTPNYINGNAIGFMLGKTYLLDITINLISGAAPSIYSGVGALNLPVTALKHGSNKIIFTYPDLAETDRNKLSLRNLSPGSWSMTMSVKEIVGNYGSAVQTKGFLSETSSTNLCYYSEIFDNTLSANKWVSTAATITSNAALAPDNTFTADKFNETVAAQQHYITQLVTTSGGVITGSFYAKAAERSILLVQFSGPYVAVDLITGICGPVLGGGGAAKSEYVGNGWWRISLYVTASGGASIFVASTATGTVSSPVYTHAGTGTSGVYLWGAQVEAGYVATSYMPTTTGTASRAATELKYPVSGNLPVNDFCVYCEVTFNTVPIASTYPTFVFCFDTNQGISIYYEGGEFRAYRHVVGNAVVKAVAILPGTVYKVLVKFSSVTGTTLYVNGLTSFPNAVATNITWPYANFWLMSNFAAQFNPYAFIENTKIYASALTDAECLALTL